MIISSTITSQTQQANSDWLVVEEHKADTGESYLHSWICSDETLIQDVCTQRGINISNELARREQILQEAVNFEIPLTPVEVMRRLSPSEWQAFQTSTDTNISYFREVFNKTTQIYRSDLLTQMGIDSLVASGILTNERASEVMM